MIRNSEPIVAMVCKTDVGKRLIMESVCEDIVKKVYNKPSMKVIEMHSDTNLLCSSSNDNPYWNGCHEGWQGSWGDEDN